MNLMPFTHVPTISSKKHAGHSGEESGTHPTNTAIFRLPGKEVQESSKWLPDQTKADPEDTIPEGLAQRVSHLLQGCCERN